MSSELVTAVPLPRATSYAVPSMDDINNMPDNGVRVVSLFCGCGGSSLGYRMHGCKILYANDFDTNAIATYNLNKCSSTRTSQDDIRSIDFEALRVELTLAKDELDILDGSPPCQLFSSSRGKAIQNILDDPAGRGTLFNNYIHAIIAFRPKIFIAENVVGLLSKRHAATFNQIYKAMQNCGYYVQVHKVYASYFGVPQLRPRVFFIGFNRDVFAQMPRITFQPKPQVSFAVACKTVRNDTSDRNEYVDNSVIGVRVHIKLSRCKCGKSLSRIIRHSSTGFSIIIINPNDIVPTITGTTSENGTYGGTFIFDTVLQDFRHVSIPEARRLCSFPDDFKMIGNFKTRWKRLGNSVPPFLMRGIVAPVLDELYALKQTTHSKPNKRRTKPCAI